MGIIKHTQRGFLVIEAGSPARETPLQNWINEGRLKRITVERVKNIEPKDMSRVLRKAKAYYGSSYDPYFIFDDKKMYCSELVYLAFKNSGIELGHLQPLKSLFVYNPAVKSLFKERWESHPSCAKDKAKSADECWAKISEQQLITPRSIAEDPKLETIYTNYLF
jgi:hypothetical protein